MSEQMNNEKKMATVPYFFVEAEMERADERLKKERELADERLKNESEKGDKRCARWFYTWLITFIALVALGIYELSFDTYTYSQSGETKNGNNVMSATGEINYYGQGETNSEGEGEEDQQQEPNENMPEL